MRVARGCSAGAQAIGKLTGAGLGGQVQRALLELDEVLVAQRFSPEPEVLDIFRYAVLAAVGVHVLDQRDRNYLWNPYRNVTWEPLPESER